MDGAGRLEKTLRDAAREKCGKFRFVHGVGRGRADVPPRPQIRVKIGLGRTTPPISCCSIDEKTVA